MLPKSARVIAVHAKSIDVYFIENAGRQGDSSLKGGTVMERKPEVDRRSFLGKLGVAVGGAGMAGAGMVGGANILRAAEEPAKGRIPDTPFKVGHMTFLTSAAAVLGEPSLKGHAMAAEQINAQGGLPGKRQIETTTAHEAAGTDANVK